MKDTPKGPAEILRAAADSSSATMTAQTEQVMAQAKAMFEQMATTSRDAMQQGLTTIEALNGMTRGNVDALLESSRVAVNGLQTIAGQAAEITKANIERTTAAARALSQVETVPELMQLQGEFARTQFSMAMGDVSKLTETMFRLMTEILEPLQKQARISSTKVDDQMKED